MTVIGLTIIARPKKPEPHTHPPQHNESNNER